MRLPNFIAILSLALLTTLGLSAQSVRVIFVSGQASLQRPDEPALRAIIKGETVIIGTRIVTGADGRVVLTPMPGVKSIITPNTTILLESVSESQTSSTVVTHHAIIDLKEGAVVSDLHKPEGVAYDYSIRTARGLAGARGTTYTVGINAAGIQTVIVAHGSIFLNFTDGRQVTLAIGHLSITGAGGETKNVGNVSELSPADQKIAQKWTETTVAAIASALESGIELDPKALENALAAAKSLGITLPPELQAQVDRLLEKVTNPDKAQDDTNAKNASEVIAAKAQDDTITGFASIDAFVASLNQNQQNAFAALREGYTDEALTTFLHDDTSAVGLVNILNLYIEFSQNDINASSVLTDLGIVGNNNFTAVGADIDGLRALILAYHNIDNSEAALLNERDYANVPDTSHVLNPSSNYFFPGVGTSSGQTIYNISFTSPTSDLYVGATRVLKIDNTGFGDFAFNGSYFVHLHASDLVDLNSTKFGTSVGSIIIEASTINLKNIDFPSYAYVTLNSKLGGTANGVDGSGAYPHFGSSAPGRVNFISGVSSGGIGNVMKDTGTFDTYGGNITIGTLGAPR